MYSAFIFYFQKGIMVFSVYIPIHIIYLHVLLPLDKATYVPICISPLTADRVKLS